MSVPHMAGLLGNRTERPGQKQRPDCWNESKSYPGKCEVATGGIQSITAPIAFCRKAREKERENELGSLENKRTMSDHTKNSEEVALKPGLKEQKNLATRPGRTHSKQKLLCVLDSGSLELQVVFGKSAAVDMAVYHEGWKEW